MHLQDHRHIIACVLTILRNNIIIHRLREMSLISYLLVLFEYSEHLLLISKANLNSRNFYIQREIIATYRDRLRARRYLWGSVVYGEINAGRGTASRAARRATCRRISPCAAGSGVAAAGSAIVLGLFHVTVVDALVIA